MKTVKQQLFTIAAPKHLRAKYPHAVLVCPPLGSTRHTISILYTRTAYEANWIQFPTLSAQLTLQGFLEHPEFLPAPCFCFFVFFFFLSLFAPPHHASFFALNDW